MCQIEPLAGEKQEKESNNAVLACNDWLRLGPGRSIPKLLDYYSGKVKIVQSFSAPSTSETTLYKWSSLFDWDARAQQFDAEYEQRTNAARESEIAYGLALDYERIRKLKDLAELLEDQLYARDADGNLISLWVPDVKVVGHGDSAETVDIERFNSSIIQQYRETLNDLAKEVGGRVQKTKNETDISGNLAVRHSADPEQYNRALESLVKALGI